MFLLSEERDLLTVDLTKGGEWVNTSWGSWIDVTYVTKSVGLKKINRKTLGVWYQEGSNEWLAETTAHWKKKIQFYLLLSIASKKFVVFYDLSFLCFNICFLINPNKYIKYSVLQDDH